MKIAVYPGSFDPITNGHLSILERAAHLFDQVIIAIAVDNYKNSLFTPEERKRLVSDAVADMPNVTVEVFDGLLADFVADKHAQAIIRGLRVVSDFEYEMQMASFNKYLCPDAETVFLTSDSESCFINASIIRNIASLNGNVDKFVPKAVADALKEKYGYEEK